MSEAAMVLWIVGIVALTLNIACICETIEKVAAYKYGKKKDPEEENTQ